MICHLVIYSYQWLTEIENSSDCGSYSIFKSNLRVQPYLLLLDQNTLYLYVNLEQEATGFQL